MGAVRGARGRPGSSPPAGAPSPRPTWSASPRSPATGIRSTPTPSGPRSPPFGERIAHGHARRLAGGRARAVRPRARGRAAARRATSTFKRPVRLGDTLHVERPDRRADAGVARTPAWSTFAWNVVNQDERVVCRARVEVLWRARRRRPTTRDGRRTRSTASSRSRCDGACSKARSSSSRASSTASRSRTRSRARPRRPAPRSCSPRSAASSA